MIDLFYILKWWFFLLVIGVLFLPLSLHLFSKFFDKGYVFAKTLAIAVISYVIFLLGTAHALPFDRLTIILVIFVFLLIDLALIKRKKILIQKKDIYIFAFQEGLFLASLLLWSYVKSFQPDIHGLEKYMDFGFMNSILRSTYFPPVDMWYPPLSINYYYFGHLTTAMLIKLTNISPFISYNLMLSTIFAFTVTSSFSIVSTASSHVIKIGRTNFLAGILGGIITALAGNLQTIYAFFIPYTPPDNPVPFWKLAFKLAHIESGKLIWDFPNAYWYPNATRFIPFTIHEFPSYSFVVSDLHGHVLDIPFVFLTIALVYSIFLLKKLNYQLIILSSFLLAIMYMTNAWDGIIYFLLLFMTILLIGSSILKSKKDNNNVKWFELVHVLKSTTNKSSYLFTSGKYIALAGISYAIFSFPFNINFKPFVSGFGIICAPDFLVNLKKIGPFLFEADHCARSPFWMLVILYGFFYVFSIAIVIKILKIKKTSPTLMFILVLILLSTILIAIPEFLYAKDIYPAHYRANTMFKLGYQAFIMLSLVSSFSIAYLLHKGRKILWLPISLALLFLVLIYPYFAVKSYFGDLKDQKGLDGFSYFSTLYPSDYEAILWIQQNIKGQPIILESQGDSYTDHGRVSANTGLPTPLGWTVHEWLWRGDYSFPQQRLDDIKNLYEGALPQVKTLIEKYNISYVFIGSLEREKYPNLNESNFETLGSILYQKGETKIYRID